MCKGRGGAEVIKWRLFYCLFELDFVFPFLSLSFRDAEKALFS